MNIGNFIKKIRKEKGLSINQLALYSNVSAAHISRIERGLREPSPDILKKISTALKIPYEELMKIAGYLEDKYNNGSDYHAFADRLKQLRNEKGLLQRELAEHLKLSRVTITQYENGSRSPDDETKKKIAKYFNVSLDYLMGTSDIRNPYNESKEISEVDKFLLKLKEEMQKQGLEFDETSPEELIETYKLLLEFKKKMKKEQS